MTLHTRNLIDHLTYLNKEISQNTIKGKEMQTNHGLHGSPTYNSWRGMKGRCNNEKNISFPKYGGAGIRVCEEWKDFRIFLKDMGKRPDGCSLDRIDNSKGYSKDNCKWSTKLEQEYNKVIKRGYQQIGDKFRAMFRNKHLGMFNTKQEAHDAYLAAKKDWQKEIL
jgi:hypothetical protein